MKDTATSSSKIFARMLAMGSLVLSIVLILLGILFFVTGPLKEPQELRRNAMTPSGTAQLDFFPSPGSTFAATTVATLDIKLIPYTVQPTKVEFVFDLVTNETIDVSDVILNPDSGIRKETLEFKRVDHGYTVVFVGQYPDGGAHTGDGTQPLTILTIKFQPKKSGKFTVNFDRERSKVTAFTNNQQVDELRTIQNIEYTVQAPPTPVTTELDDLYFKTLDSTNTKFLIYLPNSTTEVDPTRLTPGKQYTIVHTSAIQNTKKTATVPTSQVTLQFKINTNTNIRNSASYKDLSNNPEGSNIKIEGIFTAAQQNTFLVTIDPDNIYTEQREDNNEWHVTIATNGASKQCNEVCSTNSDCANDQRCYDTGTEKRCRLSTNVTNTSCAAAPDQGLRRSCNEYCADTRECSAGFTCWYNKCRLLQNLESTSCRLPQITTSTTTGTTKGGISANTVAITYQGCNEACTSNRDCAAGLRCYQRSCRNPINVASNSCSATGGTTEPIVTPRPSTTPRPSASPTPSIRPSSSPTARPSATPTVRPGTSPKPTTAPTPTPILLTLPGRTATPSAQATASATPVAMIKPTTDQPVESGSDTLLPASVRSILNFLQALPQTIGSYLGVSATNSELYGIPVPYLIIGAGAVFLIIAILLLLFARKKNNNEPPKPGSTGGIQSSNGSTDLKNTANFQPPKHNPPPSKEILARRASPDQSLIRSSFGAPISAPVPKPTPLPVMPTTASNTGMRPNTPQLPQFNLAQITKPNVAAPQPTKPAYTPAIQHGTSINSAAPTSNQTQLSAISQALQTKRETAQSTPPQPVTRPPEPPVAPQASLQSPQELLSQNANATDKLSMADRLKLKGIEFNKPK